MPENVYFCYSIAECNCKALSIVFLITSLKQLQYDALFK